MIETQDSVHKGHDNLCLVESLVKFSSKRHDGGQKFAFDSMIYRLTIYRRERERKRQKDRRGRR